MTKLPSYIEARPKLPKHQPFARYSVHIRTGKFYRNGTLYWRLLKRRGKVAGTIITQRQADAFEAWAVANKQQPRFTPVPPDNWTFVTLEAAHNLTRSSGDNDAPGVHTPTSYHYKKAVPPPGVRAYDYGTAKNRRADLLAAMRALLANPEGIAEAFYDPAGSYIKHGKVIKGSIGGHGDHLHVAI